MDPSRLNTTELLSFVGSFAKKKSLSFKERALLRVALERLPQESAKTREVISSKVNNVIELVANFDENIQKIKNKIETLSTDQEFYITRWKGKYNVHVLPPGISRKSKAFFYTSKFFSSSTKELTAFVSFLSQKKSLNLEFVKKIEQHYLNQTTFFHSKNAIKNNRKLRQAIHLAHQTLGSETSEQLQEEFNTLVPKQWSVDCVEKKMLGLGETIGQTIEFSNRDAFINQGGYGILSTLSELIQLRAAELETFQENLDSIEKEILKKYIDAAESSEELNAVAHSLGMPEHSSSASILAWKAYEQISGLDNGEYLLLDIHLHDHMMRALVEKEPDGIRFDLYDTGGGIGLVHAPSPKTFYEIKYKRKGALALSTKVPLRTFQEEGRAFLEQVYFFGVPAKDNAVRTFLNERREFHFYSLWKSLGKAKILHSREKLQLSEVCFAERIDAIQRKLLPEKVYFKLLSLRYNKAESNLKKLAQKDLQETYFEIKPNLEREEPIKKEEWERWQKHINQMENPPETAPDWLAIFALLHHDQQCLNQLSREKYPEIFGKPTKLS